MRQAEIHLGNGRSIRVVRFGIERDERIERIIIPSDYGDNFVEVVPFSEEEKEEAK